MGMKITKNPNIPSSKEQGGAFQNIEETPKFSKDGSYYKAMTESFKKPKTANPAAPIPHTITDLQQLHTEKPTFIWFGHSSYLLSCKGFNLLMDPVFSGSAAPMSFMIKAYEGADVYKTEHMPNIDLHLQSHNHYDHLDKDSVKKLATKTSAYVVPKKVDEDLKRWGIASEKITVLDWGETIQFSEHIKITSTPARHFSGRGLKANTSLWSSYVLEFYGMKIFVGGDSGFGNHFETIASEFAPFDVAILECGQYGKYWPYIHTLPEETLKVSQLLQAKVTIPVHWAKFTLANHPWTEPIDRLLKAANGTNANIITPKIGEVVTLLEDFPKERWWTEIL